MPGGDLEDDQSCAGAGSAGAGSDAGGAGGTGGGGMTTVAWLGPPK
jgi:hypothetical protein